MPCPVAPLLPFLLGLLSIPFYRVKKRTHALRDEARDYLSAHGFSCTVRDNGLTAHKSVEKQIHTLILTPRDAKGAYWNIRAESEKKTSSPQDFIAVYSSEELSFLEIKMQGLRLLRKDERIFIYGTSSVEEFHIIPRFSACVRKLLDRGSELLSIKLTAASSGTVLTLQFRAEELLSTLEILRLEPCHLR